MRRRDRTRWRFCPGTGSRRERIRRGCGPRSRRVPVIVEIVFDGDVQQEPDVGICDAVVDGSALLPGSNEPSLTELAKLMTRAGLRRAHGCGEVADTHLADLEQCIDDSEPVSYTHLT